MIKQLLNAVQTALKEIDALRYVGEDWGQIDFYDNRPPVNFPCALISFSSGDYSDAGRGVQLASVQFSVRVADMPPVRGSAVRPTPEKPYEVYDTLQSVYAVLQGMKSSCFAPITRKRLLKVNRDDSVREWVLTFATSFTDTDALK